MTAISAQTATRQAREATGTATGRTAPLSLSLP